MPNSREPHEPKDIDALKRLFRLIEGPTAPIAPTTRTDAMRTGRPKVLAFLVVLVVLSGFAALGIAVLSNGDGSSQPDGGCRAALVFRRALYIGTGVRQTIGVELGRSIGTGGVPGCADQTEFSSTGRVVRPGSASTLTTVRRLRGVDPAVAVGSADFEGVYLLAGRCYGVSGGDGLERCLKRPLIFNGGRYFATQPGLRFSPSASVGSGTLATCCGERSRQFTVVALQGVSQEVAVGLRGDRTTIYLAPNTCLIDPTFRTFAQELGNCLRDK